MQQEAMKPSPRVVAIFEAGHEKCPRCDNPLVGRVTLNEDTGRFTCLNRMNGSSCSAKLYLLSGRGWTVVASMSPDEFDLTQAKSATEALRALGLIGRPLLAA